MISPSPSMNQSLLHQSLLVSLFESQKHAFLSVHAQGRPSKKQNTLLYCTYPTSTPTENVCFVMDRGDGHIFCIVFCSKGDDRYP